MRLPRIVASLALAGALTVAGQAVESGVVTGATALVPLTLVQTTRSVQDWPVQIAAKEGFFAADGLDVQVVIAGSSAGVAQQLAAGSAEIGSVSTTQVVEAIQGGAPLIQILKNVETSPYALLGRKGLTSVEQLRGKTIMIGGPNDITRVFIDKLLAAHHLQPGDYTYVYAGAPAARFAALLSGGVDAAPLLPPVTFTASAAGFPILDDTTRYFPNFPTSGYTANAQWVQHHPGLAIAFCKAFLQGVRWLADPANKDAALQILEQNTNTQPAEALATYDLYRKQRLFSVDGRYTNEQFRQVVDTLLATKQIPAPAPALTRIFDDRYVDAAGKELAIRPSAESHP